MRNKGNRGKMFDLIGQWQQSNLSQKGFCQQGKLPYHVFHYWYKRYRGQPNSATHSFTPISIEPLTTGNIELHLPDGKRLVFYQRVAVII